MAKRWRWACAGMGHEAVFLAQQYDGLSQYGLSIGVRQRTTGAGRATVLMPANVRALRDALTEWLERTGESEPGDAVEKVASQIKEADVLVFDDGSEATVTLAARDAAGDVLLWTDEGDERLEFDESTLVRVIPGT